MADDAAHHDMIPGQHGQRLGCCGLGLGNALFQGLGVMPHATEEHPFVGKFHRPQFLVCLHQPAVGIRGDLKGLGQPGIFPGRDGGGQTEQIRIHAHLTTEDRIAESHRNLFVAIGDDRRVIRVVAKKQNAPLTRLLVQVFSFAVGTDVPVENIDVRIGVALFQFQGVLDGMGAAHLGAIGTRLVARPDALDENHVSRPFDAQVLLPEQVIHFQVGDHGRVPAIQVFGRFAFPGTRSQNRHPMVDGGFRRAGGQGAVEIAHKAVHIAHRCFQVDGDPRLGFHFIDQVNQKAGNIFPLEASDQAAGIAAQDRGLFHQMNGISLTGQGEGRGKAGHPAAHHHGGGGHRQVGLLQRAGQKCLGHRHAHQVKGLFGGGIGIIGMHP